MSELLKFELDIVNLREDIRKVVCPLIRALKIPKQLNVNKHIILTIGDITDHEDTCRTYGLSGIQIDTSTNI